MPKSKEVQSQEVASPERAFLGMPKKVSALLKRESDRGAILILGAYLEEILALIIRASCTSDRLGKGLLEFRSPAGDFSSKIALCEALGLISPDEAKALHALRKLRNTAAHFDQRGRGFDVLFDSQETVEQVDGFLKHLNLKLSSRQPKRVRKHFTTANRLLATKLYMRLNLTTRPPIAKSSKEEANLIRAAIKNSPLGESLADAEKLAVRGDPSMLFELLRTLHERKRSAGEQRPN